MSDLRKLLTVAVMVAATLLSMSCLPGGNDTPPPDAGVGHDAGENDDGGDGGPEDPETDLPEAIPVSMTIEGDSVVLNAGTYSSPLPQEHVMLIYVGASPSTATSVYCDQVTAPEAHQLEFTCSSAPGARIVLSLTPIPSGLKVDFAQVEAPSGQEIYDIHFHFELRDLVCLPGGFTCGNDGFGIAAMCLSGPCDNANRMRNRMIFGTYLELEENRPLTDASMVFVAADAPAGSIPFQKRIMASLGIPQDPYGSQLFIVGGPGLVTNDGSMGVEAHRRLGETAHQWGFAEVQVLDYLWQRSLGAFDPRQGFEPALQALRSEGPLVKLHYLSARIEPGNPAYSPSILRRDANGNPVTVDGDQLWDASDRSVLETIVSSHTDALSPSYIDGVYLDGYEEHFDIGYAAADEMVSRYRAWNPEGTVQVSAALPGLYPRVTRRAITDRWQIWNSVSPATWTASYGLPEMVRLLRQGFVAQLGWMPFSASGTLDDHAVMLNAAVATGAPLVLQASLYEMTGESPTESGLPAEAHAALIRDRLALMADLTGTRALVSDTADSLQVHFENGTRTVGVHGRTTPDHSGNHLDARVFGVEPGEEGANFNGARNYPRYGAKLTTFGGWMEVPPTPHLASSAGVTQELWFRIDDPSVSGPLMWKDRAYGVSYDAATRRVSGYLTPYFTARHATASSPAIGAPGGPTAEAWNHLVYVYDDASESSRLYINGEQVGSGEASVGYFPSPLTHLYIGRGEPTDDEAFVGSLRNVKLYSRALTTEEVQRAFENEGFKVPELIGWWPLREASGHHQVGARGAGPFLVVPLSTEASGEVNLRFDDLTPGARCTLEVNDAQVPAAAAVDGEGVLHHQILLNGDMNVSAVRIASCG
jgi:hypothetical protein